ncbi:MAG TPA: hypothetical protein VGR46_09255 [Candidatus Limnocylindria bacterium]|nr:hypothetical protein [Candidatus Limnocylindria bacterium]
MKPLKFPSIRAAEKLLGEEAYDLLDAEGYIAGLVDTYLTSGRVKDPTINFDEAAHRRALERLASRGAAEFTLVVEYGTLVGELATTLSRASGVPLRSRP